MRGRNGAGVARPEGTVSTLSLKIGEDDEPVRVDEKGDPPLMVSFLEPESVVEPVVRGDLVEVCRDGKNEEKSQSWKPGLREFTRALY